jgi:NADPH2:quinone reductase
VRALLCETFGPLEDLAVRDVDEPEAGPGQVLVDVEAAGVNFVDTVILTGGYQFAPPLPYVPGSEFAGRTLAVGEGVPEERLGERVVVSAWTGGFAERAVVASGAALALDPALDTAVAATVLQSYSTAVFALTRRDTLQEGEWVLVLGAGGGVGLAAVDVATSLGARVIAAASSPAKREAAVAAGALATIDSRAEDIKARARELSGGGVDVVVDPVGGPAAEPALRALGFAGRYHVIGFAGGAIPRVPLNLVLLNSRTVIGIEWGGWLLHHPEEGPLVSAEVLEGAAKGRFSPVAPERRPLDEAVDVLCRVARGELAGKVALLPGN